MTNGTVTFWGAATVEVRIGERRFCFDPYFKPSEPVDYVFVTHEHYDHFHEPTLRRLAESDRLELIVASPSCFHASELHSPTAIEGPEDLRWISPHRTAALYPNIAAGGRNYPGTTSIQIGPLEVIGVSSGENPLRRSDRSLISDDYAGPERAGFFGPMEGAPLPTVGYLVTETESGCSFYHPGDIEQTFRELAELRGRVTYLLLPIGKLHGAEAEFVDLIRPWTVIPIHYRLDVPTWPITWSVTPDEIEFALWDSGHPKPGVKGDDPRFLADVDRLLRGHWYPSPPDPRGFLRELKRQIGETPIALLEAGRAHRFDLEAIEGATYIQ